MEFWDSLVLPASDEVFVAILERFFPGDFAGAVHCAGNLEGAGRFEGAGFFIFSFTGRALFFVFLDDAEDTSSSLGRREEESDFSASSVGTAVVLVLSKVDFFIGMIK